MIRVIDLSFHVAGKKTKLPVLVKQHEPALGYIPFIKERISIQVIKHLDHEAFEIINDVKYSGFKSRRGFWHIPFKTIRYTKKEKPDIVIVQGLIFPVQLIWLKIQLGRHAIILAQHHGDSPFKGIKKWLQKIADHYITGYLFTSVKNAGEWIDLRIIKNEKKCFELLEASTHFKKQDKSRAKQKLQLYGDFNFLWVGRLNAGKDPLTVVESFKIYCAVNPLAKLYMIYQDNELLTLVKKTIERDQNLKEKIFLVGQTSHEETEDWYNAADFYISGSHKEGSGYALLEAMACGCIPVITNIPSFNKITANGRYGILYEAGNREALIEKLSQLSNNDRNKIIADTINHFNQELSFRSIADKLYAVCKELTGK